MAKKKPLPPSFDPNLREEFLQRAIEFQKRSRCECPNTSRMNAAMARKFLFHVIDHMQVDNQSS